MLVLLWLVEKQFNSAIGSFCMATKLVPSIVRFFKVIGLPLLRLDCTFLFSFLSNDQSILSCFLLALCYKFLEVPFLLANGC